MQHLTLTIATSVMNCQVSQVIFNIEVFNMNISVDFK